MNHIDLDKYLSEVKQRAESATSGPWELHQIGENKIISGLGWCVNNLSHNSSDFIAHARTDVPRLVEMVEYLLRDTEKQYNKPAFEFIKRELNKIARGDN